MEQELEQAKALYELQLLEEAVRQELGLNCQIIPAGEHTSIHTLAVMLSPDAKGRERVATFMFLPLGETDVRHIKLLQFYCEVKVFMDTPEKCALAGAFMAAANQKAPIGAFAISEEGALSFKYVLAAPRFENIGTEAFLETMLLWQYTLDLCSGLVEAVAEGRETVDSATRILNAQ